MSITSYVDCNTLMSVVEWIGENIEAESPRARTPLAVS